MALRQLDTNRLTAAATAPDAVQVLLVFQTSQLVALAEMSREVYAEAVLRPQGSRPRQRFRISSGPN